MDWNTDLTTQRISCAAADLIDHLYANHCPPPCRRSTDEVWNWLCSTYPTQELPASHPAYARTALAVVEAFYPEDADYLPEEPEDRLHAVEGLYNTLSLQLRCAQIANAGSALPLYDNQRQRFLARAGSYGLQWTAQPILVCMELTSGYQLVTGCETLADELTVQHGVTREDISGRSPDLLRFLRARHALGQNT